MRDSKEKTFVSSVPLLAEGSKRCPCSQNGDIRKGSNELDVQKVFSQAPFCFLKKRKVLDIRGVGRGV